MLLVTELSRALPFCVPAARGSAVAGGSTLKMMNQRPRLCCRTVIGVLDLGSILHMQLVWFLSPCGEDCTRSHRGLSQLLINVVRKWLCELSAPCSNSPVLIPTLPKFPQTNRCRLCSLLSSGFYPLVSFCSRRRFVSSALQPVIPHTNVGDSHFCGSGCRNNLSQGVTPCIKTR